MSTSEVPSGWRVLGFGKHPEVAAAIQARLRDAGLAATNFALTDDEAGDARLIQELTAADYDGVVIGSFISGQDPDDPPTEQTTLWFNRILNIIHAHGPGTRTRGADHRPAPRRVGGARGRSLGRFLQRSDGARSRHARHARGRGEPVGAGCALGLRHLDLPR
jgi:hypothetical protein